MSTEEKMTLGNSIGIDNSSNGRHFSSIRDSIHKLIVGRRSLRSKSASSNSHAYTVRNNLLSTTSTTRIVIDIPVVVWMEDIFPFLDRTSQNCLARAHPDVAAARRESYNNNTSPFLTFPMQWQSGRLLLSKQKKNRLLSVGDRPVKSVVFSPNDCTLLVASCKSNNNSVTLYDKLAGGPNSGSSTASLLFDPRYSHAGIVSDLQYSPCGTILATAGRNDGTIRLWKEESHDDDDDDEPTLQNTNNNGSTISRHHHQQHHQYRYTCIRILQIHQADLRHCIWSRTGNQIASWGHDGFIRISDVSSGALIQSRFWKTRIEVYGCHLCVAFDPTGRTVAFAHNHDVVCIWDYSNNNNNQSQVIPNVRDEYGSYSGNFVTGLTYSPDGKWLVVGCRVALVKFWHVIVPSSTMDNDDDDNNDDDDGDYTNPPLAEYTFDKEIHVGNGWSAVALLTFTNDSRYLACTNCGSQIRIIDVTINTVVATLTGHCGTIESLAFSLNGKTLASGSLDRTVRLWDCSLWCRT